MAARQSRLLPPTAVAFAVALIAVSFTVDSYLAALACVVQAAWCVGIFVASWFGGLSGSWDSVDFGRLRAAWPVLLLPQVLVLGVAVFRDVLSDGALFVVWTVSIGEVATTVATLLVAKVIRRLDS